jgi:hypothetical protein
MLSHLSTRMGRSTHTSIIYIYIKQKQNKKKASKSIYTEDRKVKQFYLFNERMRSTGGRIDLP